MGRADYRVNACYDGAAFVDPPPEQRIDPLLSTVPLRAESPEMAGQLIPVLPERFRVSRCLGRGGFGTVYEAYDSERGHPVAVKILREPHADTLYRFKQEFRVLATLKHPNLIEFYDLFEYGHLWFFTMQLVAGSTFLEFVRTGSRCDLDRLRAALRDLVRVLSWLHAHQLIHRDIKPDNVLIDDTGRLVLLDFGLARHLSGLMPTGTISVGTPAYMAPEQISDPASVNESADWYAVGVMLYQALTGRLPFAGGMMEVLAAKTSNDPAAPASIVPEVPADWSRLCLRLLARQPVSRPGGPELSNWLGDGEEFPAPRPFANDLFGREEPLQRLLEAAALARAGTPAVVEITGPAGLGKSSVLEAFAAAVPQRYPDALVLRGRCGERESLPFKALDSMMDDLSRQLRSLGPALEPLLPAEIAALVRLFPVLERVESIAAAMARHPVRIANAAELRRRAFQAFASLLQSLCSRRLVAICLDDLHWGDADSAALFQHLFSLPSVPPVVMAVAYRAESAAPEFIGLWRGHLAAAGGRIHAAAVTIGPLDPPSAVALARSLLARHGAANDELAAALASHTGGNPLLLEQLAAGFVRGSGTEVMPPRSLAELVRERMSRLSGVTRQFLRYLAAFGEPLSENVLVHMLPPDAGAAGAVSSMVSQNLVRLRVKSGIREIEIQHDQIREAILEEVPEPERRATHVRIAEALISTGHTDFGMIATQFARGGDAPRAAQYAEKAAEAAESVLAFHRAAQFYSIALAMGKFDPPRMAALYERLAAAHAAAGRGAEAAAAYLRAAGAAGSSEAASALRRHAGEQFIRSGNVREGIRVLASLGAAVHIRHNDSLVRALASILWSRCMLRTRGLEYRERQGEELAPRDLARLDVYWALVAGLSFWNPVIGTSYQLAHLRLALKTGDPRRVALALATEASYQALSGERGYPRARDLLGRALATGTRLHDPRIVGTAHAMDAMCGWLTGRWDLARDRGREAERILVENCAGVSWELGVARNGLLGGLLWGGQWREYAARLAELSADAQDRGDLPSLAVYRMNRAPLSLAQDDVEQARRDLAEAERILAGAWSGHGFHVPHFFGLFGRAQVALYSGDRAAAAALLDGMRTLRRSFLLRIEIIAVLALLLEATLAIACADAGNSAELLARARSCAERIRRKPAIWGSGLAMLIEAGAEAASGRMDAACARWSDAERELTRSGMLMFAASARYWRGRAGNDPELVRNAEEFFRNQGVSNAPRLAQMLAPGAPLPTFT